MLDSDIRVGLTTNLDDSELSLSGERSLWEDARILTFPLTHPASTEPENVAICSDAICGAPKRNTSVVVDSVFNWCDKTPERASIVVPIHAGSALLVGKVDPQTGKVCSDPLSICEGVSFMSRPLDYLPYADTSQLSPDRSLESGHTVSQVHSIKELSEDDLAAMKNLQRDLINYWNVAYDRDLEDPPEFQHSLEKTLDAQENIFLMVRSSNQQVVGMAMVSLTPNLYFVNNVVVDPNERKLGLGHALMNEIIDRSAIAFSNSEDSQGGSIVLETSRVAGALRLYERLGFEVTGMKLVKEISGE